MEHEDKADEVIEALLERMKEPSIAKKAFEELAGRVRLMQSLKK
jgi:hypothetical protein